MAVFGICRTHVTSCNQLSFFHGSETTRNALDFVAPCDQLLVVRSQSFLMFLVVCTCLAMMFGKSSRYIVQTTEKRRLMLTYLSEPRDLCEEVDDAPDGAVATGIARPNQRAAVEPGGWVNAEDMAGIRVARTVAVTVKAARSPRRTRGRVRTGRMLVSSHKVGSPKLAPELLMLTTPSDFALPTWSGVGPECPSPRRTPRCVCRVSARTADR